MREAADSGRGRKPAPAAQRAGTPRGAGIADEKKGPEIIRALVDGGAGRGLHQFESKVLIYKKIFLTKTSLSKYLDSLNDT